MRKILIYVIKILCLISYDFILCNYSKLGTHGSPRRRGANHEPPVKNLSLGDAKRYVVEMHNTDHVPGN